MTILDSASSIQRQLSNLAARKRRREELLEQVRSGKYDHIFPASEYYAGESGRHPSPEPESLERDFAGFTEQEGGVLHRRLVLPLPGADRTGESAPGLPIRSYGLDDWRELPAPVLGELLPPGDCREAGRCGIGDVCFLDTETSGLAGGTGTVVFLTGLGWWERDGAGRWQFVVEQYLIRDFPHEPAKVYLLAERLSQFRLFCTYNGRTFDVPLLRTRAIMNRCRPGPFRRPNVDLLPFCRRFWRGVLPSVSLKQVELDVLGLDRGPDIDGSLIPRVFFDLSQGRHPRLLPAVLSHNVQDIATLGGLLEKALRIAADPFGGGELSHWAEFAALARHHERRRDPAGAARALERALERAPGIAEETPLLLRLAAAHKRLREWPLAVETWSALATSNDWLIAVQAATELAKYHEHVAKDFAAALRAVEQVRRKGELRVELASYAGNGVLAGMETLLSELARRENRLRKRLRGKTRDPEAR